MDKHSVESKLAILNNPYLDDRFKQDILVELLVHAFSRIEELEGQMAATSVSLFGAPTIIETAAKNVRETGKLS